MSTEHLVSADLRKLYRVYEWRNAAGVLTTACPQEWHDIVAVLREFRLYRSEVEKEGGSRSLKSQRLDSAFYKRGWAEKKFATAILVDQKRVDSPTHSIDCFKGRVAIEVEWNNKDPFFDRDLNNFRLLFDLRAIDAGVIITRATELHTTFKRIGRRVHATTTHHERLLPRLDGGSGGGCPVLVFAVSEKLFVDDVSPRRKSGPRRN